MDTRNYNKSSNQTTGAPVRRSSQMERARRHAIGVSAALMVLMLTLAVVFTTLAINMGRKPKGNAGPGDEGPGDEVQAPIVFVLPVSGEYDIIVGYSETELQWNETAGQWQGHRAVKIAVGKGTAVLATYAGTITNVVNDSLEGTIVEITHRDGIMTRYLGLDSNLNVRRGDTVQRGQQIGVVGDRPVDRKDGPHVKIEVLKDGKKVNPADYIPNLGSGNK